MPIFSVISIVVTKYTSSDTEVAQDLFLENEIFIVLNLASQHLLIRSTYFAIPSKENRFHIFGLN